MSGFVYLLDTNIISDLIRNPAGIVAQRIAEKGESAVCTSIVVACELRFGARKKGSALLADRVEEILSVIEVLALDADANRFYAEIRTALEAKGTPVGPNDLLIAAQTMALGLTMVTANSAEFLRIPGLPVENWLGG
ncbi:MAG TPA: VapC toxin family PIN domain ribonuclease [Desulfobulbaceae bacterium]|nr:MAG: transcriptional regulator [Deltaproteobacteria bacterium RIFOXYD12_FULL_53_23]HCC54526.1 VapC toxin family PIN domain ribonuclease [Desulfobulbaceae bacterium]